MSSTWRSVTNPGKKSFAGSARTLTLHSMDSSSDYVQCILIMQRRVRGRRGAPSSRQTVGRRAFDIVQTIIRESLQKKIRDKDQILSLWTPDFAQAVLEEISLEFRRLCRRFT